jgi:hypothetical protein
MNLLFFDYALNELEKFGFKDITSKVYQFGNKEINSNLRLSNINSNLYRR